MSNIKYFTEQGLKKLKDELHLLKTKGRADIAKQIAEARDKGDLSENAEYDAAKEAQGLHELKISKLESTLSNAKIIDKKNIDNFLKDKVEGENFNRFIVIKDTKKGPYLSWVKVGISDLYNVEVVEGLDNGDVVFILPSKSLFDYQQRFKERVSGSFSFG